MSKMLLAKMLRGKDDKAIPLSAEGVILKKQKKALDVVIDEILASIDGLKGGDAEDLKIELGELKTTFNTFMTGEDDDNGALDRLKELVAAIQANKDSIDALVSDKATKEALEAVIERVAALEKDTHTHANKDVLDGIGKNETSGNLTFNNKELTGETGIAFGATAADAKDFTGQIKFVLEEIEIDDTPTPEPEVSE